MNKLTIAVYAIAKNEEAFVDRWMDSMQEADKIVVADTGSTDRTVEKLRTRDYPNWLKSRASYLPLLEMSVSEDPEDDRNMHYLGREYMYYFQWEKCIETLKKHLEMPRALWQDERCASMRYIANSYKEMGTTGKLEIG